MEETLNSTDPILAWHVADYRFQTTRFDGLHLHQLSKLRGFTANLTHGIAVEPYNNATTSSIPSTMHEEDNESDKDTDDEAEAELEAEVVEAMGVAVDPPSDGTGVVRQE